MPGIFVTMDTYFAASSLASDDIFLSFITKSNVMILWLPNVLFLELEPQYTLTFSTTQSCPWLTSHRKYLAIGLFITALRKFMRIRCKASCSLLEHEPV